MYKNALNVRISQTMNNTEFEESLRCTAEIHEHRFLVGVCYQSPAFICELLMATVNIPAKEARRRHRRGDYGDKDKLAER